MSKIYLCDKKKGACKSWEKLGWTEHCESDVGCNHTTNPDHALCYGCDDSDNTLDLIAKCVRCSSRKETTDDNQ